MFPGLDHENRLEGIDYRIAVSGVRGKSSTVLRLYDVLAYRQYDVYGKVTGNRPFSLYERNKIPIEREGSTRLYENYRLIKQFDPKDAIIMENQATYGYTTQIFNNSFARSNILFITNIRKDHTDVLGSDIRNLSRVFARSAPSGCDVVLGDQNSLVRNYMKEEMESRGSKVHLVDVPSEHEDMIGSETVHGINNILNIMGEKPLQEERTDYYLETMQPEWMKLANGSLIFNGADINDIESTEMIRRKLQEEVDEKIVPFLYIRQDRRGRTTAFIKYLKLLLEKSLIDKVHVAGHPSGLVDRKLDCPVEIHDDDPEKAEDLLDSLASEGRPIFLMGNTVSPFMRSLEEEIESISRDYKGRLLDIEDSRK